MGRGNYNDADRECSTEEYSQDRGVISVLYNANYAFGRSADDEAPTADHNSSRRNGNASISAIIGTRISTRRREPALRG